jgi:hypothetical protein
MELIPSISPVQENKKFLLPWYAGVYCVPSTPILTRPTKRHRRLPSRLTPNTLEDLQARNRN